MIAAPCQDIMEFCVRELDKKMARVWCKKSDDELASSFPVKNGSVNASFRAMERAKPVSFSRIGS